MFVGGLLGFLLDNTIPGSPEERSPTKSPQKTSYFVLILIQQSFRARGLVAWAAQHRETDGSEQRAKCYDLPIGMPWLRYAVNFFLRDYLGIGMPWLRRQTWAPYVPFLPTFAQVKN